MTKRNYLAAIARSEAAIAEGKERIALLQQALDAGQITIGEAGPVFDFENDWLYAAVQERGDVERSWVCRNWTAADHASFALVAANCD